MVREEILGDGTRLYWLTMGPGMPENQVSEARYLGWVIFRARRVSSIGDPELRARCAEYQRALDTRSDEVYDGSARSGRRAARRARNAPRLAIALRGLASPFLTSIHRVSRV